VVKEVIKAYYDKKNKKTQGQITAENQKTQGQVTAGNKKSASGASTAAVAAVAPRAALKRDDSAAVARASATAEPQR
jgi:hypothetical protein